MLELIFDRTTHQLSRLIREEKDITIIEFFQGVIDKLKRYDNHTASGGLNPEGLLGMSFDTQIIETISLERRARSKDDLRKLDLRRKCLEKLVRIDIDHKKKYINDILHKAGIRLQYNEIGRLRDEV